MPLDQRHLLRSEIIHAGAKVPVSTQCLTWVSTIRGVRIQNDDGWLFCNSKHRGVLAPEILRTVHQVSFIVDSIRAYSCGWKTEKSLVGGLSVDGRCYASLFTVT